MRPIVGITADYDPAGGPGPGQLGDTVHFIHDDLIRAVAAAGGSPILVPCSKEEECLSTYIVAVDGLIFSGSGADLHPSHYGEEPVPALGRLNPERLDFELALARLALADRLPVLGICGGLQTLNVAAGGTLYQDLPSQCPGALDHKPDIPCSKPAHPVSIAEGSRLKAVVGSSTLQVNSTHHQAIKNVAEIFNAVAVAPDGAVEAVETRGERFVLGIQWHPEYMAPLCQASRAIFKAFVAAAGAHAGL